MISFIPVEVWEEKKIVNVYTCEKKYIRLWFLFVRLSFVSYKIKKIEEVFKCWGNRGDGFVVKFH